MTELSIMLISGTLGEGATVTVTAHPNQQQLDYKVSGVTAVAQGNGKRRATETSQIIGGLDMADLEDDGYEVMEA